MKLPPFAAGIDTWGQVRHEVIVELPPNEPLVQLLWINTSQNRTQTSIQHVTSQVGHLLCGGPDREERFHAGPIQESDPNGGS